MIWYQNVVDKDKDSSSDKKNVFLKDIPQDHNIGLNLILTG